MPGFDKMALMEDFRGGVNKGHSKFDLLANQSWDCLNVFSSENGDLCKRGGFMAKNTEIVWREKCTNSESSIMCCFAMLL